MRTRDQERGLVTIRHALNYLLESIDSNSNVIASDEALIALNIAREKILRNEGRVLPPRGSVMSFVVGVNGVPD